MASDDIIVLGGGISGLSFAHFAAARGHKVRVLEKEGRVGGCIDSRRLDSGFWFEMGAHTLYNSYGGLADLILACGLRDRLLPRARVPFRMLRDGTLRSVVSELSLGELFRSAPRAFVTRKDGLTVSQYYSRIAGHGNYQRVLTAFFAAVPSQNADAFPASMLFKSRPRRKDFPRSFTLDGGLSTVVEALARSPGITVERGVEATSVERTGDRFSVSAAAGRCLEAGAVAVALPPPAAAKVLATGFPELAAAIGRVSVATVLSTSVVVAKERVGIEPVAGIVPAPPGAGVQAASYFSAVTRDVVPDRTYRAFTFHFRAGLDREARLEQAARVLGVSVGDFAVSFDKVATVPSPAVGHGQVVEEIARHTATMPIGVLGNYFGGLAIEDCIARSREELSRIEASK